MRAILLGVMGFWMGCAGAFTEADELAIRGVLDAQAKAWNVGDIEAFMAGYERSEKLVFTSGAQIRRGFDQTLARYRARYVDTDGMGTLGLSVLEVRPLPPDAALVMGRYTLTNTPHAGGGLFTLVFQRGPQGWRVIHDHTSAEPSNH